MSLCHNVHNLDVKYVHSEDIGEYEVPVGTDGQSVMYFLCVSLKCCRAGGKIHQMAWDPTGERFVVTFEGKQGNIIAVYSTQLAPLDFSPRSLLVLSH